eukprot:6691-Heterococcus_DN1.PRE.2
METQAAPQYSALTTHILASSLPPLDDDGLDTAKYGRTVRKKIKLPYVDADRALLKKLARKKQKAIVASRNNMKNTNTIGFEL